MVFCSGHLSHTLAARLSGGFFPLLIVALLTGCASSPPQLPFPAYIATDELADVFLAELPGVRAKRMQVDPASRTGYYRIDLPVAWNGSSGASPGKSLEIFVLAGNLSVGDDLVLGPGGYAYLPPGGLGFNLRAYDGARVLYRIAEPSVDALIRTPLILDSSLLDWAPTGTPGESAKELRFDPGSQARTWLLRLEPGASLPWRVGLSARDGYLLEGSVDYVECVTGKGQAGTYLPGGYFRRPADNVHGGPEVIVNEPAVWLLHEAVSLGESEAGCVSP